ncbi:hypothetical protein BKA93DRAFT_821056 [Sparassis latifolia]
MKDTNSGEGDLLGLVQQVPLQCGAITTWANLYVADHVPFDLLLGRPWQRDNQVTIDERPDGTYLVFKNPHSSNGEHELLATPEHPLDFEPHSHIVESNSADSFLISALEPSTHIIDTPIPPTDTLAPADWNPEPTPSNLDEHYRAGIRCSDAYPCSFRYWQGSHYEDWYIPNATLSGRVFGPPGIYSSRGHPFEREGHSFVRFFLHDYTNRDWPGAMSVNDVDLPNLEYPVAREEDPPVTDIGLIAPPPWRIPTEATFIDDPAPRRIGLDSTANLFPFDTTFNVTKLEPSSSSVRIFEAIINSRAPNAARTDIFHSLQAPRTCDPRRLLKTVVQDDRIITMATDSSVPVAPRRWDSLPSKLCHHADSAPRERNNGASAHDAHRSPSMPMFLCSSEYSLSVPNASQFYLGEFELSGTLLNDANGTLGMSRTSTGILAHSSTPLDNSALTMNPDGLQDANGDNAERAEYAQRPGPVYSHNVFLSEPDALGVAMETPTGDTSGQGKQVDTGRVDTTVVLDSYGIAPHVEHTILADNDNTVVGGPCDFTDITTTHAQEDLQRRSTAREYQAMENVNAHGFERAEIAQSPWPASSYDTLPCESNVPTDAMETHGRDNNRQDKQDTGRVDAATIVEGYRIPPLVSDERGDDSRDLEEEGIGRRGSTNGFSGSSKSIGGRYAKLSGSGHVNAGDPGVGGWEAAKTPCSGLQLT